METEEIKSKLLYIVGKFYKKLGEVHGVLKLRELLICLFIEQIRKLKLRVDKRFAQGHTASW